MSAVLEYEPNNTTAKDFYPHILAKVNQIKESSTSEEGSDENFNYTSSEFVDFENENDNFAVDNMNADNVSQSSSDSILSNSSSGRSYGEENDEGGGNSDIDSNSDGYMDDIKDQHELIGNSPTPMSSSSSSSKSDPRRRTGHTYTTSSISSNCSHKEDTSHSYTSLLLEESLSSDHEAIDNNTNNNNLPSSSAPEQQPIRVEPSPTSSPLTRKIVEMIRAKCTSAKLPTSSTKKPK